MRETRPGMRGASAKGAHAWGNRHGCLKVLGVMWWLLTTAACDAFVGAGGAKQQLPRLQGFGVQMQGHPGASQQ